ncbi:MAG: hypothetical protein KAX19_00570 [Candidatus Brocadiae bacterium]|nr:hypothetical protein [Candidatus Brocadiia bacterium]
MRMVILLIIGVGGLVAALAFSEPMRHKAEAVLFRDPHGQAPTAAGGLGERPLTQASEKARGVLKGALDKASDLARKPPEDDQPDPTPEDGTPQSPPQKAASPDKPTARGDDKLDLPAPDAA